MFLRRCILALVLNGYVFAAAPSSLGTFVAVGDSLTAGFQNFSLYTSRTIPGVPPGGQEFGYAQLIAKQAHTTLQNPTVIFPGLPPALVVDPSTKQIVHASNYPGIRINPFQTLNMSVPSYTVGDALEKDIHFVDILRDPLTANPQEVLAATVLGPSACGVIGLSSTVIKFSTVTCAVELHPKTVLVSLGSNDVLQAFTLGAAFTDPGVFTTNYLKVMLALKATGARIMVANVPDVTTLPYLWTAQAFKARCGYVPSGAYFVPNLVDFTNPSGDICFNHVSIPSTLVQAARTITPLYNAIIASEAAAAGAVVLDLNNLLKNISTNGITVGDKRLTTQFLGGLFSLDGMHPTNTGYAIIANQAINLMNQKWGTSIPTISLEQIAKDDPLIPR